MKQREDWPLGPALKQHRISRGLSVRAAAELTNKVVSETRWRQLESGFQSIPGGVAPIKTTLRTVVAAAKAVKWDVRDAAKVAGFNPDDAGPVHVTASFGGNGALGVESVDLKAVPASVLLAEIGRRLEEGSAHKTENRARMVALNEEALRNHGRLDNTGQSHQ